MPTKQQKVEKSKHFPLTHESYIKSALNKSNNSLSQLSTSKADNQITSNKERKRSKRRFKASKLAKLLAYAALMLYR